MSIWPAALFGIILLLFGGGAKGADTHTLCSEQRQCRGGCSNPGWKSSPTRPEQFTRFIRCEVARMEKMVKAAGLRE